MISIRSIIDVWFPTSGPFALVYPTVLLATLYGHWQAGAVAYGACFFWAWYFVLPAPHSLHFEVETDPARVGVNAVTVLIVLIFAETFRVAVERARKALQMESDRRALLLAEIEHRTKNNFAMVAGLLDIQKRRESAPEVVRAFDDAIGRVHSFAAAYSHLAMEQGEGAQVEMHAYLSRLVDRIDRAAFSNNITLTQKVAQATLPRDEAVAIGLYLNEALTNCAKYAFADGRPGHVEITFNCDNGGWRLTICDDGLGNNAVTGKGSGLGSSLLDAFARQANANHSIEFSDRGCLAQLQR